MRSILWAAASGIFVIYGIKAFFAKKPYGFWANGKDPIKVSDVKGYNNACGKLWIVYGIVLFLCGVPLFFAEQNSPVFIVTVLGVAFATLGMVIVYVTKIESKYRL